MLSIKAVSRSNKNVKKGVKIIFCFADDSIKKTAGLEYERLAKAEDFSAKTQQLLYLPALNKNIGRTILTGLGKRKDFTMEILRRASSAVLKKARDLKTTDVQLALPVIKEKLPSRFDLAAALAEGAWLGLYRFDRYKTQNKDSKADPKNLTIVCHSPAEASAIAKVITQTRIIVESVMKTRDLVNIPGSEKYPKKIVEIALRIKRETPGLNLTVLNKKQIEAKKMGGLLGVSAGSVNPPYFLHFKYKGPGRTKKRIALVGKGVTFDSGGLSLKPSKSMEDMKMDMAGAATVIYIMQAAAKLKLPLELHGVCPLTENLPSATATKPGDVLKAMNGKTMEILNTDAEGRLILADALTYASRLKPDQMLDFATLTGAAIYALGMNITALMGDKDICKKLMDLGEKTGEDMWSLPLPDRYKEHIKSKVADIKNIGNSGEAGTVSAGLFLKEFVDVKQWVHLDIAGPAYLNREDGVHCAGATGTPVRTILEYLRNL